MIRRGIMFGDSVTKNYPAQFFLPTAYDSVNPFAFMELQDVQELTNFFESKVSSYQVAVQGEVAFDHVF